MYRSELAGEETWTSRRYDAADVIDLLQVINSRLASIANPAIDFVPVDRPGDAMRRREKAERARRARAKIEETEWEEA